MFMCVCVGGASAMLSCKVKHKVDTVHTGEAAVKKTVPQNHIKLDSFNSIMIKSSQCYRSIGAHGLGQP